MKHPILLLASALLICTFGQAQLTSPAPEAGEFFDQSAGAFVQVDEDPGTTGQSWDFSSLISAMTFTTNLLDPATTANGKVFGGSQIAAEGEGTLVYYSFGESYEYHGGTENNLVVWYDDTEEYFPYPFNIGDTWSDTFSSEYGAAGITVFRTGTVDSECLSSGTVTLPNTTTYENAYRVHVTENLVDSTFLGTLQIIIDGDYWFNEDYLTPLVATIEVTSIDIPLGGEPLENVSNYSIWLNSYTLGIPESATVDLWGMMPNPASKSLTIVRGAHRDQEEYSIFGMDGRLWLSAQFQSSQPAQTLDVSQLPDGVYLVRTGAGEAQQLVIQH